LRKWSLRMKVSAEDNLLPSEQVAEIPVREPFLAKNNLNLLAKHQLLSLCDACRGKVPEGAECQDPIGMIGSRFFRCSRPAKAIVARCRPFILHVQRMRVLLRQTPRRQIHPGRAQRGRSRQVRTRRFRKGVCRYLPHPENPAGGQPVLACRWADKSQTLCTNPACLASFCLV
jgi:hypothetical protein